jgi:hypothetical protein
MLMVSNLIQHGAQD